MLASAHKKEKGAGDTTRATDVRDNGAMFRLTFPRWRFSLFSLLLVTALICVSASHWTLSMRAASLDDTVRGLRQQLGMLNVEDKQQIYIREVQSNEPLTWKFRIYLPPDEKFVVRMGSGNRKPGTAAATIEGTRSSAYINEAEEFTLTVAIGKEVAPSKNLHLRVSMSPGTWGMRIDPSVNEWLLQKERSARLERLSPHPQQAYQLGSDVEFFQLLRPRADGREEGVVVWLEHQGKKQ